MTIDERLEALIQSVELLAGMQRTTEREVRRTQQQLRSFMRIAGLILLDYDERLRKLERDEPPEPPDEPVAD